MEKISFSRFEAAKLCRQYGPPPSHKRRAIVMMRRRGTGFLSAVRAVAITSGVIANHNREADCAMPEVTTQVDQDDSIEKLSGRDLDKRVAHEVMGLVPCNAWREVNFGRAGGPALISDGCEHNGECCPAIETSSMSGPVGGVPRYSEFIQSAIEVVERMRSHGWKAVLSTISLKQWYCEFIKLNGNAASFYKVESDSLPEAVCRAALKATEAKVNA